MVYELADLCLGKLHFQTTFNLNRLNNFSINEYSLMIPFGELNKDKRIKLAPIEKYLTVFMRFL